MSETTLVIIQASVFLLRMNDLSLEGLVLSAGQRLPAQCQAAQPGLLALRSLMALGGSLAVSLKGSEVRAAVLGGFIMML